MGEIAAIAAVIPVRNDICDKIAANPAVIYLIMPKAHI
jgi:hypothetical protein